MVGEPYGPRGGLDGLGQSFCSVEDDEEVLEVDGAALAVFGVLEVGYRTEVVLEGAEEEGGVVEAQGQEARRGGLDADVAFSEVEEVEGLFY